MYASHQARSESCLNQSGRAKKDMTIFERAEKPSSRKSQRPIASKIIRVPSLRSVTDLPSAAEIEEKLRFRELFDKIMEGCLTDSPTNVFESIVPQFFEESLNTMAVFWRNDTEKSMFVAETQKKTLSYNAVRLLTNNPTMAFVQDVNAGQYVEALLFLREMTFEADAYRGQRRIPISFALQLHNRSILGIIELTTLVTPSTVELRIVEALQARFTKYAGYIFCPLEAVQLAQRAAIVAPLSECIEEILSNVKAIFGCDEVELWTFSERDEQYMRWYDDIGRFGGVFKCNSGVVGSALRSGNTVKEIHVSANVSYVANTDGEEMEPLLVHVKSRTGTRWAIALRGRRVPFTDIDVNMLGEMMPFILRSVSLSENIGKEKKPVQSKRFEEQSMMVLRKGSVITRAMVHADDLNQMEIQCRDICNAESVRVLLIDQTKRVFYTRFGRDSVDRSLIPINTGIAGEAVALKRHVIVATPAEDPRLIRRVDFGYMAGSTYSPNSLIAMPIVSSSKVVVGVVLLAGKKDGAEFTDVDAMRLQALMPFCANAMYNGDHYHHSRVVLKQLKKNVRAKKVKCNRAELLAVMNEVHEDASAIVDTRRVTLFLTHVDGSLYEHETVGAQLEHGIEFAEQARVTLDTFLRSSEDKQGSVDTVVCSPVFDDEDSFVGVIELAHKTNGSREDIDLMRSCVLMAALSLKKAPCRKIVEIEGESAKLKDLIGDNERNQYTTPPALVAKMSIEDILSLSFDAGHIDEMELIRIVFAIFDKFGLKTECQITNQKMYFFLVALSKAHGDFQHFDWRHTIEVLQFTAMQFELFGLGKYFSSVEILALLVAALCHDLGHDGYLHVTARNNFVYDVMHQYQSTMESHHCELAVEILGHDEANILSELPDEFYHCVWQLVIRLILRTDMSQHFLIVDRYAELCSRNALDLADTKKHRELMLVVMLKAADMSCVCRPKDIADKSLHYVGVEFFMSGRLDYALGMVYSGKNESREWLNEQASVPGFLKSVCFPFFQLIEQHQPALAPALKQFKRNMKAWGHVKASSSGDDETSDDTSDN